MKIVRIDSLHVCLSDIRFISEFSATDQYFGFNYAVAGVAGVQCVDNWWGTFRETKAQGLEEAQAREAFNRERDAARIVHSQLIKEWGKTKSVECRLCIKW